MCCGIKVFLNHYIIIYIVQDLYLRLKVIRLQNLFIRLLVFLLIVYLMSIKMKFAFVA